MKRRIIVLCAVLLLALFPIGAALADDTPTPTPTETPTPTFTPTATSVPGSTIIWADGTVTLSEALLDAIAVLLEGDPPEDAESLIYAATHVSGNDLDWSISIVNLDDGVDPPYDEWTAEDIIFGWFVECEGEEPTWSCDYYELPEMGGSTGLRFPWRTGYSMIYGILGVHEGTGIYGMMPESLAVDFVSGDSYGADAAPDTVIAAADGVITSVCSDGISMAIRVDGGPVSIGYFHFETGQTFTEGQSVTKGEVLGVLKHGSFPATGETQQCGWGSQAPDKYHLHFVFYETTPGYLEIGGCVLNTTSENFVCDGVTYPVLSWLPNGGNSGSSSTEEEASSVVGGGAHIWDGIVEAFVSLNEDVGDDVLPDQNAIVPYIFQKVDLVIQACLSIVAAFYVFGLSGQFFFIVISAVIAGEISLILFKIVMWFGRILLPFI